MKNISSEYKVYKTAKELNEIIINQTRLKVLQQKHNLSGEYSQNNGIDLYNTVSLTLIKPNLGPLVKLNFSCVSINLNETESKVILKRVNGETYNVQFWFSLLFIALSLSIVIYQFWDKGIQENFKFLITPVLGILYFLIIEFIAELTIESLIKKVERILNIENIKFTKF